MKSKYKVVMFDLDGTLTASARGVRKCIEIAMEKMGREVPNLEDESKYVGPPLIDTFKNLCKLSEEESKRALKIYREAYEEIGIKENRRYKGIKGLIENLKESDVKVCIATSKYEGLVGEVLEIIGLEGEFEIIVGSTLDGERKEKDEVIRYLFKKLKEDSSKEYKLEEIVMIGDTTYDAKGAKEVGCDFIGVTYGYGKEEEMREMGVNKLCKDTKEIEKYIKG